MKPILLGLGEIMVKAGSVSATFFKKRNRENGFARNSIFSKARSING
jgi:hypothetical protein